MTADQLATIPPAVLERTIRDRATGYPCTTCGAARNVRCRVVTHRPARPGYPAGTVVDVMPNPCPERSSMAWRQMLAEGGT